MSRLLLLTALVSVLVLGVLFVIWRVSIAWNQYQREEAEREHERRLQEQEHLWSDDTDAIDRELDRER